ncbi:MAG: hypothetical protein IPJ39_17145 [Saprospiraceae bacterium]|nr:hypothetical protein [Saprospiraceae bacterium]
MAALQEGGVNAVTRSGTNNTEALSIFSKMKINWIKIISAEAVQEKLQNLETTKWAFIRRTIDKRQVLLFCKRRGRKDFTPQPHLMLGYTGASKQSTEN